MVEVTQYLKSIGRGTSEPEIAFGEWATTASGWELTISNAFLSGFAAAEQRGRIAGMREAAGIVRAMADAREEERLRLPKQSSPVASEVAIRVAILRTAATAIETGAERSV